METKDKETVREFRSLTDTPANIRAWIDPANREVREMASLEDGEETPSGRFHAERVLELLDKKSENWTEDDLDFAQRVIRYAHRSAGIAEHHPHREAAEVGNTGMTKNEIARSNWGLPARP
ncbi:MAG: DUF3140 domain-containing protein [Capsulimonadales bacterium]|nr:DUF3140 domain-containing protein [Capsulimonadales bacterium]